MEAITQKSSALLEKHKLHSLLALQASSNQQVQSVAAELIKYLRESDAGSLEVGLLGLRSSVNLCKTTTVGSIERLLVIQALTDLAAHSGTAAAFLIVGWDYFSKLAESAEMNERIIFYKLVANLSQHRAVFCNTTYNRPVESGLPLMLKKLRNAAPEEKSAIYSALTVFAQSTAYLERITVDPRVPSLLHLAVLTKDVAKIWQLVLHGADTTLPFIDEYDNPKVVWKLCKGEPAVHQALLHFWTPQSHNLHPRWVKNAIV